jgi:hypothetical protein
MTATVRPFTGNLPVNAAASATGHHQARPQHLLRQREGDVARGRCQQGIADRARQLRVRLLLAALERTGEVVEACGLAGMHARAGADAFHAQRHAGRQAAARAGRRYGVERNAQRLGLLG